MASVSSLVTIEVDELGRPLNLKATDETDTLASSILSTEVKVLLTEVNTSSIYWASAYDVVRVNRSVWDSGGAPELPADVSGRWENAYNYANSTSGNTQSVYDTVFAGSGTWGTGGGGTSVPADVSGRWEQTYGFVSNGSGNIGNTSSYVKTASGNIGNTSSYVVNASGNINIVSSYIVNGSGNIGNTSSYVRTASGNITNVSSYISNGSGNIGNTSSYVVNGSGNIGNTSSYVVNGSGNIGNTSSYVVNASGNINIVSSYIVNGSGNIGNTSSYVRTASGNIGNTSSYVVGASGIITQLSASVSATVFGTSGNWNTAYTHSQVINANPHITNLSSLDGVSLDILGLQAGQFLKYKPGFGWTNDSIAITTVGVNTTPGFISNSSSINFSGTQGVSLQAAGNTLTFSISGNVSGATSATDAFSSTYALSATSALNAQQAPNGFNVTGTVLATTVSATNYLNVRPNVSAVDSATTTTVNITGDYNLYLVNTSTTGVTLYLPPAASWNTKQITISKVEDSGSYRNVTVSSSELQTATNTVVLYDPTESVTVVSNGTNWYSLDYDRAYGVVVVCKNDTGATLTKGTPVRISGATGANILITATSAANNHIPDAPNGSLSRCIGVVEHDIPTGEFGHVLTKGILYKYNTSGYTEGDQLYLSPSGGFTNVKPIPPYETEFIGIVTRQQANNGSILIDIANPIHINDIVGFNLASGISNRDLIAYDLTTSTFKNYAPSSFNVSSATSATLAYSSTYALSSTSALNTQQAPNGFNVTGTLAATTVSATTYENLGNTVAKWNASAIRGIAVTNALPDEGNVLTYNAPNWVPAALPTSASTAVSATSAFSSTNAFSATNALSATSALNASRAPAGFTVTGTLSATTISATTYQNIDHTLIANIGTNTHVDIDNHIADTNNPHSVTAEQVGNTTAQWNASSIFDYEVKSTTPLEGQILVFRTSNNWWIPENIGNTTAQWNASALRSSPLSATLNPTTGQSLVYNGTVWTASSVAGGGGGGGITSINSQTGAAQTISAASGLVLSQGTDSITLGANYTSAIWNASALVGYPISSTLTPVAGQALMYNGSQWTASAALFAYTYGSGAPTGGSNGDIYLQTDVESLQIPSVSATTYLNLPSGTLTWTYATSATSALNAQQAPNGFSVTGNLTTTSGDVSAVKLTDYSESKSSPSISSSSLTLDLNAAQVFTVSLNSNISTLTISNTDSRANTAQGFTLILTADGTARTITWPGSVKWPGGTGPTLTSTNNKVDILSFVSPDNGTTWYGFTGGQNY